jgi:hypothetical protein
VWLGAECLVILTLTNAMDQVAVTVGRKVLQRDRHSYTSEIVGRPEFTGTLAVSPACMRKPPSQLNPTFTDQRGQASHLSKIYRRGCLHCE